MKSIFISLPFLFLPLFLFSQDTLLLKSDTAIIVYIDKVFEGNVYYFKTNNPDDEVRYKMSMYEIQGIRYHKDSKANPVNQVKDWENKTGLLIGMPSGFSISGFWGIGLGVTQSLRGRHLLKLQYDRMGELPNTGDIEFLPRELAQGGRLTYGYNIGDEDFRLIPSVGLGYYQSRERGEEISNSVRCQNNYFFFSTDCSGTVQHETIENEGMGLALEIMSGFALGKFAKTRGEVQLWAFLGNSFSQFGYGFFFHF